jgi:lysophospholipase L1-like esterase
MKKNTINLFIIILVTILSFSGQSCASSNPKEEEDVSTPPVITTDASNSYIQYVGRMDFTNPKKVKFSAAGAYIQAKFEGTSLDMIIGANSSNNYVQVVIDNLAPVRLQIMSGKMTYKIAQGLSSSVHTVLICKETEASIGSLEFYGFNCQTLLPLNMPTRKIEFYGDSITCGAKMLQGTPCDLTNNNTNWNAANSGFLSYGALTAQALNAQWQITAWSGIGLVSSCCGMTVTMPDVYDRTFLDQASTKWDFTKYVPDAVSICLGQNDGTTVVESQVYKDKYIAFIKSLRSKYPNATIFCITSPMADTSLLNAMNTSLQAIVNNRNADGDTKVYKIEVPHGKVNGCINQGHPSAAEHQEVAIALAAIIKVKMGW